jgi:cation:H+ antiporter
MIAALLGLAAGLIAILVASELFTNALEHLGERLRISEGLTGSVFAAVGTALPETIVPLLALVAGTDSASVNEEIGVGAILGAPLMLSTLSFFLLALGVVGVRGWRGALHPETVGLQRDLSFFIVAFALAAAAMWMPLEPRWPRLAVSAALVFIYLVYVAQTLRASRALVGAGHATAADEPLVLTRLGLPSAGTVLALQLAVSLALLLVGAKVFINSISAVAHLLDTSTLLLSVLVIPIATELPEKINSITWARRDKDTLGVANITGALVFQGTLLPALGILLTPWSPRHEVLYGIAATLVAAFWLRLRVRSGRIVLWSLCLNGALYLAYLAITLS